MAPRRRVDPVLNEHNRRKLARIFREVLANEPYPTRPTIPMLLQAALRDAGYWEHGEEFGFVTDDEGGGVILSLPWITDDGKQLGQVHVPTLDENFDEISWDDYGQRSQRSEGPGLGDQ
jgi:hypothetical protein